MKKFEVTLKQTRVDWLVVEVKARDELAANRVARKLGEDRCNDFCDGEITRLVVHDIREIE